jgi:hypothetical protein
MAYQKLPGIYRKESPSPAKQKRTKKQKKQDEGTFRGNNPKHIKDIAAKIEKSTNKPIDRIIAELLKKGFTPTKIADSFAKVSPSMIRKAMSNTWPDGTKKTKRDKFNDKETTEEIRKDNSRPQGVDSEWENADKKKKKIKVKRTMAFKMKGPTFFSSALKHSKGANHNKEFGQGHTWGARSKSGVNTHEAQGPTSNQQQSQPNYDPSPTKHIGGGHFGGKTGFSKDTYPVLHPHPHGSKGVGELMKEDLQQVGKHIGRGAKAVGKAGKWVGRGIKKGIKNLSKIRIKGGGRGGYEMGPGGRGGWRG